MLFTFLLFSTLISNQDKDGKKLLEVYLENRDQILGKNKPEIDYKWDINQSDDYVLIAINGVLIVGLGQCIKLFLKIEENTRKPCNHAGESGMFCTKCGEEI